MELTQEEKNTIVEEVSNILESYNQDRENLVPILQNVQEKVGFIAGVAMEKIAEHLDIPAVDVYGLATFYNQFRLNPPGENEIKVCMGTACYMVGGEVTMESFERRLDINEGETTSDRKFSLDRVACVGCCTMAPVIVRNDEVEGYVTPTRVDGILNELSPGSGDNNYENSGESQVEQETEGAQKNE